MNKEFVMQDVFHKVTLRRIKKLLIRNMTSPNNRRRSLAYRSSMLKMVITALCITVVWKIGNQIPIALILLMMVLFRQEMCMHNRKEQVCCITHI